MSVAIKLKEKKNTNQSLINGIVSKKLGQHKTIMPFTIKRNKEQK